MRKYEFSEYCAQPVENAIAYAWLIVSRGRWNTIRLLTTDLSATNGRSEIADLQRTEISTSRTPLPYKHRHC